MNSCFSGNWKIFEGETIFENENIFIIQKDIFNKIEYMPATAGRLVAFFSKS